jgi:MarR-like DNA-binding transcriptional regulator SgrR of sgrS sRNA
MKLTEETKKLFSEVAKKHNLKNESFLMRIFKNKLSKELENDKDIQQAIKDGDAMVDALKKTVKAAQEKGYKIPSYAKKYLK